MKMLNGSAALLGAALLVLSAPTFAMPSDSNRPIDEGILMKIVGGSTVEEAGDVNGDGIPDVMVSRRDDGSGSEAGQVFVVFGSATATEVDVDMSGDWGFSIQGSQPDDFAFRMAALGDLNQDGLDDIVVGAIGADNNGRARSGSAYVILGRTSTTPVSLTAYDLGVNQDGFRIDGSEEFGALGWSLAGMNDVTGDGVPDIAVAAPFLGRTYVVPGKVDTTPVDLATYESGSDIPPGAMVIKTPHTNKIGTGTTYEIASLDDTNGDGRPDLAIGILRGSSFSSGYVVYCGDPARPTIDVTTMSRKRGFTIEDAYASISSAGDWDGDGLTDVLAYAGGNNLVVLGSKGRKRVVRHGDEGVLSIRVGHFFAGSNALDQSGDWDGDGHPDLLLGAPDAAYKGIDRSGIGFLVLGREGVGSISVFKDRRRFVRVGGLTERSYVGYSVSKVGDMDGKPGDEIALGAYGEDAVYVISSAQ